MIINIPDLIVRLISISSCLFLILVFFRRKEKQQVHRLFLSFVLCLIIYDFPYAMGNLLNLVIPFDLNQRWVDLMIFLSNLISATAISCAGANWLMLAASYTRNPAWIRGWRRASLYIPATLIAFTLLMNPFIRLWTQESEVIQYLRVFDQLLFLSNTIFIVSALILNIRFVFDIKDDTYKKQAVVITIGSFFPILGGIPYIITTFLPYRLIQDVLLILGLVQQLSLLAAIFFFAYALLKMGFLNILPVALREIFHNMNDIVIVLDTHNRIVQSNGMGLRTFPGILPGKLLADCAPEVASKLNETQALASETSEAEIDLKGSIYWVRSILLQVKDQPAGQILILTDITRRKRAEEQLAHDALHDRLTGLPNRTLLIDRLNQVLKRAVREVDFKYAVLFLDLDRFKRINDSLGHQAGDQLLIQVAQRLSQSVRVVDTVARLGGDEFIVLLEDIDGVRTALEIALRIQESLTKPFSLNGQEIFTSASIGIALGAPRYHNPDDLLRDADTAMYQAKQNGKSRYTVFDKEMHTHVLAMVQLESELRKAVERQEFELYYQPIVSLSDLHILGFEALLHWRHPRRGLLSPADFLLEAEEADLILPIGYWVIQKALSDLQSWQAQFPQNIPMVMTVNLSRKQLLDSNLLSHVRSALDNTNLPPDSLVFEISENMLIQDELLILDRLSQLKALGVRLFIDDFGTGYASLHVLPTFPIDTIKIDHSFICRITNSQENFEIVRAIVNLGQSLNKTIIAEGVETREEYNKLLEINCTYGQGYYFYKPCPYQTIHHLLSETLQEGEIQRSKERAC